MVDEASSAGPARTGVRLRPDRVSGISRPRCPDSSVLGVRFQPDRAPEGGREASRRVLEVVLRDAIRQPEVEGEPDRSPGEHLDLRRTAPQRLAPDAAKDAGEAEVEPDTFGHLADAVA